MFMRLAVILALLLSGCGVALRRHTIPPYDTDATQAAKLEAMAQETCSKRGQPVPPRIFQSDGCSVFWDGNWVDCCVAHDVQYWCGGPYLDRLAADLRLGVCVASNGYPVIGQVIGILMPPVIQLAGMSVWPTWYRWGYGHPSSLECYFEPEAGCE